MCVYNVHSSCMIDYEPISELYISDTFLKKLLDFDKVDILLHGHLQHTRSWKRWSWMVRMNSELINTSKGLVIVSEFLYLYLFTN